MFFIAPIVLSAVEVNELLHYEFDRVFKSQCISHFSPTLDDAMFSSA